MARRPKTPKLVANERLREYASSARRWPAFAASCETTDTSDNDYRTKLTPPQRSSRP